MRQVKEKGVMLDNKDGPIEVWLTKTNIDVTCRVVFEDETDTRLEVDSLSVMGAQREMTAYLIGIGYMAATRWETTEENPNGDVLESLRRFRPAKQRASA
jgi:hypothetical protein